MICIFASYSYICDYTVEKLSSKTLVTVSLALQLGFSIAVPLLVLIGGGIWLDRRFGTMPLLTITGVIISMAVSVIEIYQIIKAAQKK